MERIRAFALMSIITFSVAAQGQSAPTPPPKATDAAAPAKAAGTEQANPFAPDFRRPATLLEPPERVLGLTLREALQKYGVPDSVHSLRGPEPWQDDVVFRYDQGYELHWYRDRVWQVRLGAKYKGMAAGIYVGDPEDKLEAMLGTSEAASEAFRLFRLPDHGYPLYLRAAVADGKVAEIYVLRGDF